MIKSIAHLFHADSKDAYYISNTINRCSFGQNGDSAFSHILLVQDRRALGTPAVRSHKLKMTGQIGPTRGLQDLPGQKKQEQQNYFYAKENIQLKTTFLVLM